MSETITRARELIQSRLDEVAGEVESLSGALEALGSNGASAAPTRRRKRRTAAVSDADVAATMPVPGVDETPAPKPRGRPKGSKGKRSRGNKADQVKALAALAKENPGASNADIAEALNVSPATAAVLLSKFKSEGLAERRDGVLRVGKVSTAGRKRKAKKAPAKGKAKATAKKAPAKRGKAKRASKAKPKDDVADAIEMLEI